MAPAGQGLPQDDFGGGIFRGRNAPGGSVYDAINAIINDERLIARRGGSVYRSGSAADDTLLGLWDGVTSAGQRTFFWSDSSPYVLDSNDSSLVDLGSIVPSPLARGVEIGGIVFFRAGVVSNNENEVIYAGSRKTAAYSTGTAAGSGSTLTGTGTSWLANVDPGMILLADGTNPRGIVKSVESNTSLTLTLPIGTWGGGTYSLAPVVQSAPPGNAFGSVLFKDPRTAFHATAGQRLLRTRENRVYYSVPATSDVFIRNGSKIYAGIIDDADTDYHELPRAAVIVGADSIRDTGVFFTTAGVWTVENFALDAVDDFGNPQRPVQQISQDVILWGDAGVTGWAGRLVVPAIDDVYVMGLGGGPEPVGGGTRPLYREYVEAGYKPGIGSVYHGHYLLPVLDGSNVQVDTLVCRLDLAGARGGRRPGWTRWADHASGKAFAVRVGSDAREPKLLGLAGARVTDLTGCFSPSSSVKADADGTDHELQVVTQDFASGAIEHTFLGARVALELVDAASDDPTFEVEYASGPVESEVWTSAGSRGESDGEVPETFRFARRARALRLRVTSSGAAARAVLRSVEPFFRPRGRS